MYNVRNDPDYLELSNDEKISFENIMKDFQNASPAVKDTAKAYIALALIIKCDAALETKLDACKLVIDILFNDGRFDCATFLLSGLAKGLPAINSDVLIELAEKVNKISIEKNDKLLNILELMLEKK